MLNQTRRLSPKTSESKSAEGGHNFEDRRLGIWRILSMKESGISFVEEARTALPLLMKLTKGIHTTVPDLFVSYILCQLWGSIYRGLEIYLSSWLLRQIEAVLMSRDPDSTGIISALLIRLIFAAVSACIDWWISKISPLQESKIETYLHLEMMKNNLGMDMPTFQAAGQQRITASETWRAMKNILSFFVDGFSVVSQALLLFGLSRNAGGTTFTLLSIARPVLVAAAKGSLFRTGYLAYVENEDYKRMKSLEKFSDGSFRQDVISYGLADWILKQYIGAFNGLGDTPTADAWEQVSIKATPAHDVYERILGEIPMIYVAISIIFNPSSFSLASIAILHQTSDRLRSSVSRMFYSVHRLRAGLAIVRRMDNSKMDNILRDGTAEYCPTDKESMMGKTGMGFELRNVYFSYAGGEKSIPAISNLCLDLKPGSITVIVGENGSGKSTLIRILSRLYDPTSGEVYIDGRPSKDYSIADLHRASAILSQDSLIYPLSLSENIGLGHPSSHSDPAMIEESAREGGAADFIGKLSKGYDTCLDPYVSVYHSKLQGNKGHPLAQMAIELRKKPDLSGGEKQRVVASRTFMRFKSGNVNFVAVDEPSSALDAEGEYKLFQQLLANREGKTMVFVTHRFGHLTKVADQIVCMKEGRIVEFGTHEQLVEGDGEYAKLYNIQAQAFR